MPDRACRSFAPGRWMVALAVACWIGIAAHPAAGQWDDRSFLAELRRRGMWELAEAYCVERLADKSLGAEESAELVCQWIQAGAEHALATNWERRDPVWNAWVAAVTDWKEAQADHPRRILIEVQEALATGARGRLERQEAQVFGRQELLESARAELRSAIDQLEAVQQELEKQLREQYRTTRHRPGELTSQDLLGLRQQVTMDLAKARLEQALAYDAGTADRTAALAVATETFAPLAAMQGTTPGMWEAAVLEVTCLRLAGKLDAAQQKITQLLSLRPPSELAGLIQAEQIHLLSAAGRPEQAVEMASDRSRWGASAERDLAALEILVSTEMQGPLSTTAAELAETIGEVHPPHWQRQVDLLLSGRVSTTDPSSADSMDQVQLKGRAAAGLAQQGQIDRAAEGFRQAAREAAALGRTDQAVDWLWQAAALELQKKEYGAAEETLYELSQSFLNHPRASQAHLLSIYCLAQLARDDTKYLDPYSQRLEEHVRTWSRGETTNQARHWLVKLAMSRQDWEGALEHFPFISSDYSEWPELLQGGAECFERLVDRSPSELERQAMAARAARFFEQYMQSDAGKWPDVQGPAAILAARFRILYLPDQSNSARRILSSFLDGAGESRPEWIEQARVLLAVCLAGEGEWETARETLSGVSAERPEAALSAAEQFWELGSKQPPDQRRSFGALGQLLIERLAETVDQLTPDQQRRWHHSRARLLALEGRTDQAAQAYRDLLKQQPDQLALQKEFAQWLGSMDDKGLQSEAQQRWRNVVDRSAPYSAAWWEAKYQIARLHESMGQVHHGLEMIQLLKVLAPEMGGEQMRERFDELERRCRERQP